MSYDFSKALLNLRNAQKRFDCYPNCRVWINDYDFMLGERPDVELKCLIKPELLDKVLNRELHWNNLEIGCLIRFHRTPNTYQPDVHTLLSFFHLPRGDRVL